MIIVVGIVFYMKPCVIEDTLTQYIVINQILYLLTWQAFIYTDNSVSDEQLMC